MSGDLSARAQKAEAELERLKWIIEQYERFSFWHSYIPSAAELGARYDRDHAANDAES